MEMKGMDKFLEKLITQTHSRTILKNTRKTPPTTRPGKNPGDSIFLSYPTNSPKKHEQIITRQIKTGGDYQHRKLKRIPTKPGNRLECVGEFTGSEPVDILMSIGITEIKPNKIQNRGAYQQLLPMESAIYLCLGGFTLKGAVGILMESRNNRRKDEKRDLRWKGQRRYFQKRTADPRVYL